MLRRCGRFGVARARADRMDSGADPSVFRASLGVPPGSTDVPSAPSQAQSSLPLPATADLAFWRGEVDRAKQARKPYESKWQENLDYYTGRPLTDQPETDYVNVNVDFYQ